METRGKRNTDGATDEELNFTAEVAFLKKQEVLRIEKLRPATDKMWAVRGGVEKSQQGVRMGCTQGEKEYR